MASEDCPSPEKKKHSSKRSALRARSALEIENGIDLGLAPYRCGDHWHIGHRNKNGGKYGRLARQLHQEQIAVPTTKEES